MAAPPFKLAASLQSSEALESRFTSGDVFSGPKTFNNGSTGDSWTNRLMIVGAILAALLLIKKYGKGN